ncbi:MAG TPA: IS1380 family transposase [Bdellovibrionales bacterium]|nr:MAG: hypothetical protein A2Z97_04445 [Bdellovibrionales bacterium GWB1_52_6]OFZ02727.1 MAG: hypothetical protein A2X97_12355 [Bdellovibrionales bacterium GWA1_52_35]OFZ39743.1 MAG: hypothetical protein A2070_00945 [Bdellovibrionales bacterium GWC1_52_8]HAR42073.1 IS1380 family transposase [Bdellovibrionales bacterium]HCM41626.1 IS1380 family transposase [Bdellovibrionales bacterium]
MSKRKFREAKVWEKPQVKIEWVEEEMTSYATTGTLIDLFAETPHFPEFIQCLPKRVSNNSYPTEVFALSLMAGFIHGQDSIDDQEEFEDEPGVESALGETPKPRATGDWLRDFTDENRKDLNHFLHRQAMSYRKKIAKNKPLILDIDSTSHVQHGEKMEGLAWNYKKEWCLDSLVAFDEVGLCHGMELRPGNTFSSVGAEQLLESCTTGLSHNDEKYFRADSAFCNEGVLRACLRLGYRFTITAHENMGWMNDKNEITNWTPWIWSEADVKKAEKRGEKLPECEVGHYLYRPSWSDSLRFSVVVVRTKSQDLPLLNQMGGVWEYYAVMTNFNLFKKTDQEVIEHHRKRGNSENFIREEKYNYDMKHFPCQKLSANHAYGQLGLVAHNFLRTIAVLDRPDKPHFAKKLRRKFIFIPGRLIKHARTLTMKIPLRFREAVTRLIEAWQYKPEPAIGFG